jgi:hypothetical protein
VPIVNRVARWSRHGSVSCNSTIKYKPRCVQVVVGVPPQEAMGTCPSATPFGVTMGGTFRCQDGKGSLTEDEVKLAYSQGSWAATVAKQMHDSS